MGTSITVVDGVIIDDKFSQPGFSDTKNI